MGRIGARACLIGAVAGLIVVCGETVALGQEPPAAAMQEAYTDFGEPGIVPADSAEAPPTDGMAIFSTPAGGNFVCANASWVNVHSVAGGYVTGNCAPGWHLHRTIKSDPVPPEGIYFDGGYLFGNVNGCGWIRGDRNTQVGSGTYNSCVSPGRNLNEFASWVNCAPGTCADGTLAWIITHECTMFGNVRPWGATAPTDRFRLRYNPYRYAWRYVTRDGRWVMVRDPGVAPGAGNWGFVPRACFGNLPGAIRVP
jgi:hypothetical protein